MAWQTRQIRRSGEYGRRPQRQERPRPTVTTAWDLDPPAPLDGPRDYYDELPESTERRPLAGIHIELGRSGGFTCLGCGIPVSHLRMMTRSVGYTLKEAWCDECAAVKPL